MPNIGGGSSESKTYAVGFWESENCDNSLAEFPSGTDFSWGVLSFEIDGCDADNYVEVKIIDGNYEVILSKKYTANGKKEIDLSQYSSISSTEDIKIRMELTSYI